MIFGKLFSVSKRAVAESMWDVIALMALVVTAEKTPTIAPDLPRPPIPVSKPPL